MSPTQQTLDNLIAILDKINALIPLAGGVGAAAVASAVALGHIVADAIHNHPQSATVPEAQAKVAAFREAAKAASDDIQAWLDTHPRT